MFQFPAFAPLSVVVCLQHTGLPHSEICGSKAVCASPQLIAACHVLLRLREPRHPPYALTFISRLEYQNCKSIYLRLISGPAISGRIASLVFLLYVLFPNMSKSSPRDNPGIRGGRGSPPLRAGTSCGPAETAPERAQVLFCTLLVL